MLPASKFIGSLSFNQASIHQLASVATSGTTFVAFAPGARLAQLGHTLRN